MTRSRIAAALVGLAAAAALALFALYNQGQPVVLRFGFGSWRGEAVHAIYAGVFVGLLAMFLVGLPGDLAARRERRRLARRVSREEPREAEASPTLRRKTAS